MEESWNIALGDIQVKKRIGFGSYAEVCVCVCVKNPILSSVFINVYVCMFCACVRAL